MMKNLENYQISDAYQAKDWTCGSKPKNCNPDVAPRLTSGGYEDKSDVITPINILFRGGGEF